MQKIQNGVTVSIILEPHQAEMITQIAKRFGIKKSQAHRILLDGGLDSYAIFEGTGMAKLTDLTLKVKRALAKSRQLSLI